MTETQLRSSLFFSTDSKRSTLNNTVINFQEFNLRFNVQVLANQIKLNLISKYFIAISKQVLLIYFTSLHDK